MIKKYFEAEDRGTLRGDLKWIADITDTFVSNIPEARLTEWVLTSDRQNLCYME